MERKAVAGGIRNKERSKKKFLDAVGEILKTRGYAALKINDIAKVAGVDKKMIYTYFGGIDGLIDEYISTTDFWMNVKEENIDIDISDGGKKMTEEMLHSQFDYLLSSVELQKVLIWRLSEERQSLKKMIEAQEETGEMLFKGISDPHFGDQAEKFRAIMALAVSGIYHLTIDTTLNGSVFCGIDLKTEHGRQVVKEALSFIVDQTYENLK
ncbi:transcriptional regulator, TetR family [Chishuiella changwenlii]|jgi:AcrR family transcriptional regulator|uniref:TetR family transcriptional regulator n=1 Tax=Chishuiella changwenlii TaxID=1434701 RepID=A0A1M6X524_9FLAO|nr:TetR/AcrR family transcriptional regulator [Chishuiella changwenlii]GGE98146.1 TetR family transcriptional regulator [Chishuiella changwenlii]SHL01021.1 transcriptional regulator, TetR family [Chishuiella changwenlii]